MTRQLKRAPRALDGGLAVEIEAVEGLELDVAEELREVVRTLQGGPDVTGKRTVSARVASQEVRRLADLRTAMSAFVVITKDGRRPSVLLGDAELLDVCRMIVDKRRYRTVGIDAPGRESKAMTQVQQAITNATGLSSASELGDLLVRVRRAGTGWQALVRTTPRPLSTRPWRTVAVPGAVNAAIAACMVRRLHPSPNDRFVNLMSGSGTLAIERALAGPATRIVGIDDDPAMLAAAAENARAAGVADRIEFIRADAMATGLADDEFDRLAVVLPYGTRIGTHAGNEAAYPNVIQEAGRIATGGARFVALTQEVKLFERVIEGQRAWRLLSSTSIWQGGQRPRLFDAEKNEDRSS